MKGAKVPLRAVSSVVPVGSQCKAGRSVLHCPLSRSVQSDDLAHALLWAQVGARASGHGDGRQLEILAAAHAELGDFPEAVRWQTEAIRLARGPRRKALLQASLELYESGRPFRQPPR